MAVDRLPPIAPAPSQVQPNRNVRQAQAAFFQAALGQAQGVAAAAPAAAAAPRAVQAPAQPTSAEPAPRSSYRPGSLLDIKI
jgi:hypothetical protein